MEGRFSITVPRIFVLHCSLGECLSLCYQKTYPAHNNRTGNWTRAIAAAMTTSSIFICELVKINFSLLELSSAYLWIAWARGGGVLPYKGLMGTCGPPGFVFRDFCLKQGRKISDICLKQGQATRGRAAPPHPGIYRVHPPGAWAIDSLKPRYRLCIRISSSLIRLKWQVRLQLGVT